MVFKLFFINNCPLQVTVSLEEKEKLYLLGTDLRKWSESTNTAAFAVRITEVFEGLSSSPVLFVEDANLQCLYLLFFFFFRRC